MENFIKSQYLPNSAIGVIPPICTKVHWGNNTNRAPVISHWRTYARQTEINSDREQIKNKVKMNIALDTNIWIYLTKDTFFKLWTKFKEMKETGEITVIINDIILKEWARNKPTTIKTLTNNIKNEYKSALNLSNYLQGEVKTNYLQTIAEYKDEANRIKKAEKRVDEVETFMKSCKIIETTEAQKLFISELVINKKPPFQNNKNNFNDALILRNICEYVKVEYPALYDLIYVSNNPDDFIIKGTNEVYQDIFKDLKPIRLKNVTELGEALKLAPELIEDFDEWLNIQLDNQAMYELDIMRGK